MGMQLHRSMNMHTSRQVHVGLQMHLQATDPQTGSLAASQAHTDTREALKVPFSPSS